MQRATNCDPFPQCLCFCSELPHLLKMGRWCIKRDETFIGGWFFITARGMLPSIFQWACPQVCASATMCVPAHSVGTNIFTKMGKILIFLRKPPPINKSMWFSETHWYFPFISSGVADNRDVSVSEYPLRWLSPCHATTHSRALFFLIPPSLRCLSE